VFLGKKKEPVRRSVGRKREVKGRNGTLVRGRLGERRPRRLFDLSLRGAMMYGLFTRIVLGTGGGGKKKKTEEAERDISSG